MLCPICNSDTKVLDCRKRRDGEFFRRRECFKSHRFSTIEKVVGTENSEIVKRIVNLENSVLNIYKRWGKEYLA